MKELEEMKKCFDEFMAKAEQTLEKMKGTAPKEILTKEEKEYLEAVIRPFRDRICYVLKRTHNDNEYTSNLSQFIHIEYEDLFEAFGSLRLPDFKKDTMYKGMELDKEYTLEELGLFKENKL